MLPASRSAQARLLRGAALTRRAGHAVGQSVNIAYAAHRHAQHQAAPRALRRLAEAASRLRQSSPHAPHDLIPSPGSSPSTQHAEPLACTAPASQPQGRQGARLRRAAARGTAARARRQTAARPSVQAPARTAPRSAGGLRGSQAPVQARAPDLAWPHAAPQAAALPQPLARRSLLRGSRSMLWFCTQRGQPAALAAQAQIVFGRRSTRLAATGTGSPATAAGCHWDSESGDADPGHVCTSCKL